MEYILAGNIGGTNTQIALVDKSLNIIKKHSFLTKDISSSNELDDIFVNFIKENSPDIIIKNCVLGCAGPILFNKEKCKLSNSGLCIETIKLQKTKEKCNNIILINDMEAFAYGFSGSGNVNSDKILILMPGTGLGVVFLFKCPDNSYKVISSEFSHNYINLETKKDIELFNFFNNNMEFKYDNVVSGPGIVNLYKFLKGSNLNNPEEIVKKALSDYNNNNGSAELEAVKLFVYYIAKASAGLSLSFMPKTILLAGNIINAVDGIIKNEFTDVFKKFFNKDYREFSDISISFIENDEDLSLKGCADFGFKNP
ncbi:ROK family protein [Candidatus Woesearchaeota archaeon]|nr:ROK family protein [Candidatus Woesearchaeota archaeon]